MNKEKIIDDVMKESARSIGVKYKNLVKKLTQEELKKGANPGYIPEILERKLPKEIYDTWEGAQSEVERIIDDEIFNFKG